MISGLPTENLASPRTATKTNQNPAPGPATAKDGQPSARDEFKSHMPEEADTGTKEPAPSDDAVVATPVPAAKTDSTATVALEGELAQSQTTEAVDADAELPATTRSPAESDVPAARAESGEARRPTPAEPSIPESGASTPETSRIAATDVESTTVQNERTDTRPAQTIGVDQSDVEAPQPGPKQSAAAQETAAESPAPARATPAPDVEITPVRADRPEPAFPDQVDVKTTVNTSDIATADKATVTAVSRDGPAPTPDVLVSLGTSASSASSGAPIQANAGLTPTAPSIPVASPNEISYIILNAVKNGIDPQEQLVVQLDPPELGRVTIDFKFDAQGLQQIVVTSENPEALRRLREMHLELTEALKQNGLSNQNMSFQQEADGRGQSSSWQLSDQAASQDLLVMAAEPGDARAATLAQPSQSSRDRLDLLL